MFLLGFAIILVCVLVFTVLIGVDSWIFFDFVSWLVVIVPLVGVLTATQGFKVFYAGLRAAVFPDEEISEEMRGRAASLFRMLSKAAVAVGGIGTLIGLLNMLMNMNFSDRGGVMYMGINIAYALVTLVYGLLLALAVFEPVVFILKKRYKGR